jgi:signal transduction histidine kinase
VENDVPGSRPSNLLTGVRARLSRIGPRLPRPLRGRTGLAGLSLARRFLLVSLGVVIVGGAAVAWSLAQLIQSSAINQTTSVTALYVSGFVAPELQSLADGNTLTPAEITSLQNLLANSAVGQRIVSFRVWSLDGEILYSPWAKLIGQRFPMEGDRGDAAHGAITGDISDLSDPENVWERKYWSHLLEIYLPVRASGSSRIIAVAELYQLPDELEAEVARDQRLALGAVAVAALLAFGALALVVRQGSRKITSQESELRDRVRQLSGLLEQNAGLHDRLKSAAARTTQLNELERRRIGSDLHDGPTQTLAFAMLRLDAVEGAVASKGAVAGADDGGATGRRELERVRGAMAEALGEMRTIAAGLRTPEFERATPGEIVRRAVAEHERHAGAGPKVDTAGIPMAAPLATKIALYRILVEALSNAARHGGGQGVRVHVTADADGWLLAEVADEGPGFDARQRTRPGHLGLAGMRERAELLGGRFELESRPGSGTRIRVRLPLAGGVPAGDD